MAMMRLKPFDTTTTAPGTVAGLLAVAATTGLARGAQVYVDGGVAGGWLVEVIRVLDATKFQARLMTVVPNRLDLSAIPGGAAVHLEEQWVQDLYQDDAPANIAIPTHAV